MTALLDIANLRVFYGKALALDRIDCRVNDGAVVTVIGRNGAGKTTLLGAIMGLIQCDGNILYGDDDLSKMRTEACVRAGLCLVPERRELFGGLSVEDNLRLGAFARISRDKVEIAIELDSVYLRFPRLGERRKQFAKTLSGGERQMLALGRALMGRPRLLMLDEPSLGLAPRIVEQIFRVIVELRQCGVSILFVEQNARAALRIADYAYVLETGAIILQGQASDLARDPKIIDT